MIFRALFKSIHFNCTYFKYPSSSHSHLVFIRAQNYAEFAYPHPFCFRNHDFLFSSPATFLSQIGFWFPWSSVSSSFQLEKCQDYYSDTWFQSSLLRKGFLFSSQLCERKYYTESVQGRNNVGIWPIATIIMSLLMKLNFPQFRTFIAHTDSRIYPGTKNMYGLLSLP